MHQNVKLKCPVPSLVAMFVGLIARQQFAPEAQFECSVHS